MYYAVEGHGKTTAAAHAPEPLMAMVGNETGYLTLRAQKRVPLVPYLHISTWEQLLALPTAAIGQCKTLCIDALGSADSLCAEFVRRTMFKNSLEDFQSYGKGVQACVVEMSAWVAALDALRAKGISILMLGHAQVRTFKNPMGSDFDRYQVDCDPKVWSVVSKFADAVLFGNFLTVVEGAKGNVTKKGKGVGDTTRLIYCQRRDAFDAKNRYGMPDVLDVPDDPAQVWNTIETAMKGANSNA